MRTIAIINLKGGTAKTTTTVNLAAELRHRGKRVLCIDADPQHNLTDFLGASAEGTTITDLLAGRVCEADIAVQRLGAGFGCVPSDLLALRDRHRGHPEGHLPADGARSLRGGGGRF